jgi:hypothetical protein
VPKKVLIMASPKIGRKLSNFPERMPTSLAFISHTRIYPEIPVTTNTITDTTPVNHASHLNLRNRSVISTFIAWRSVVRIRAAEEYLWIPLMIFPINPEDIASTDE